MKTNCSVQQDAMHKSQMNYPTIGFLMNTNKYTFKKENMEDPPEIKWFAPAW